jgi:hypothetical protein
MIQRKRTMKNDYPRQQLFDVGKANPIKTGIRPISGVQNNLHANTQAARVIAPAAAQMQVANAAPKKARTKSVSAKDLQKREKKLEAYKLAWAVIDHLREAYNHPQKNRAWEIVRALAPKVTRDSAHSRTFRRINDATALDPKGMRLEKISEEAAEKFTQAARVVLANPPNRRY